MATYGVVGLGSIGRRHLANLRQIHPREQIYAVSASGVNHDVPVHADDVIFIDQLISLQPKYVIVASPAPFHASTAQRLIANQIPVLIEKPLAHDTESGKSLQAFCLDKQVKTVAVGYCLRFLESAVVVKNFLGTEALGNIYNVMSNVGQYLPSWRPGSDFQASVSAQKKLGGGALLELSHELDYLQWLFGDLTLQYSSLRSSLEFDLDVEDIADLAFSASNGIHINVHLDFVQKATQRKCEILGQNGRVDWDILNNSVTYHSVNGEQILYSNPMYDKNQMYISMIQDFERCLAKKGGSLATIDSSVKVLELIESAKKDSKWRSPN